MNTPIGEKKRKIRSDKKRDIKPAIPIDLYEIINKLSYITNTPMRTVGVYFCTRGLMNQEVINYLSNCFKRDYWFNSTLYPGRENYKSYQLSKDKKRLMMRVSQPMHEQISYLSFSMGLSVSSATGLLLYASVNHAELIKQYVMNDHQALNYNRYHQLQLVCDYLSKNNLYEESLATSNFISSLVETVKKMILKVL